MQQTAQALSQCQSLSHMISGSTHPENMRGGNRPWRSRSGCTQASWTRLLPKHNPPLIASLRALRGLSPNQANLRLSCSVWFFFTRVRQQDWSEWQHRHHVVTWGKRRRNVSQPQKVWSLIGENPASSTIWHLWSKTTLSDVFISVMTQLKSV